jgi:SNF2 family DNA or RNA helicase
LVSEFRKHKNGSPQLVYETKWHRVVLDEGEFAESSWCRTILIVNLAHDIRDHNRTTAKAMRRLEAVSRWAVTGTPIQNNLSDIASLYQFLRIEPYTDEPTLVKQQIKQLFEERNPEAVSKARRLIRCVMLRRSLRVVVLPEREELIHRLNFSPEEAEVYDQARTRTGALLDEIGGDVSPFHILPWINSLRIICNLGTRAKLPKHQTQPTDSIWNTSTAQEMFNTLTTTGAAICNSCSTDLAAVATEVADRVSDISTQSQLASCSYLICGPCIEKQIGMSLCCTHSPAHEMRPVSTLSSSLSIEDDRVFTTASMPTKVKALLLDLDQHVEDEKW